MRTLVDACMLGRRGQGWGRHGAEGGGGGGGGGRMYRKFPPLIEVSIQLVNNYCVSYRLGV